MKLLKLILPLILIVGILSGCVFAPPHNDKTEIPSVSEEGYFDYKDVPAFDGKTPYVVVNGNEPYFSDIKNIKKSFESYGELDRHGRCTECFANIGKDLMPTEERGSIGSVKPSGWQTAKYDCVDGKYLYNRCHLIGFQLTGENANVNNLITGTRYMNVQGMLPFEDMVADYINETDNHVLYRVTPIFLDGELVARGVLMEGYSVEDEGEGICFNVFCYNSQPEIEIDYVNGESRYVGKNNEETDKEASYVLNKSSKKFHYPSCSSVASIKDGNKEYYKGSREGLILDGYAPCGSCKP